uniref:B30.2/SPRY domain-containing protein n=1 Tax=Neogobius melanostomus TaxID=47308 RepID=A0A8C6TNG9_9GOBI
MESLVLTDEPEPQLRSGLLIDQATVLGNLGHRVWEKMKTMVKYSPVILDPNTAQGNLRLSEDLSSVRHEDTQQLLPLNPERFTNYPSVLGSEGFSSGRYQWEVKVGDHSHWAVGVANESANRRARCKALPKDGLWCLMHHNNEYSDVVGNTLKLRRRPERIFIDLDCDTGIVSIYDRRDMTHLCSHQDTFTEKVYPYYSLILTLGTNCCMKLFYHLFIICKSHFRQDISFFFLSTA